MLFDPGIVDVLRDALPGLGDFFFLITQLGGDLILILILLVGYWSYNKREALLATFILVFAVITQFWLKIIIANDRPPASNWHPSADPPNYSTPSGHSINSATLYGWATVRIKTWWMAIVAIVLTTLVGISRVYLGVHYLGDVLLGWGLGIIFVILFAYLLNPAREFLSRYNAEHLLLVLIIIGFLMTLIAAVLPQPPNDNFGNIGGLIIGLGFGLILEMRFVDFSNEPHEGQKWRLVLRALIGVILVIAIMFGLSPILPSEEIWLRMIRYFLVALTGIFVWPAIFKRANL